MSCINIYYSRSFIYCRNESKHRSRYHYFLLISLMKNTLFLKTMPMIFIGYTIRIRIRIYICIWIHQSLLLSLWKKTRSFATYILWNPNYANRKKNFSYRQKGRTRALTWNESARTALIHNIWLNDCQICLKTLRFHTFFACRIVVMLLLLLFLFYTVRKMGLQSLLSTG